MNVNKLFPRLGIRAKLLIAFVGIALVPLLVAAGLGTRASVQQIREGARQRLEHDVELAQRQTAVALRDALAHVEFVAEGLLPPHLDSAALADAVQEVERGLRALLAPEEAFQRVKVVGVDGRVLLVADGPVAGAGGAEGAGGAADPAGPESGLYYAWRAGDLPAGERLLLPVELRGRTGGAVPAMAFLVPIRDKAGVFRGVVVGEAEAAQLFSELELASPGLEGVTGLVDGDGLFLYHSVRKRDWSTLLASRDEVSLSVDVGEEVASHILSGGTGVIRTADGRVVAYRPVLPASAGIAPLTLYRSVPLGPITTPVRNFLGWVLGGGVVLVALVLGLAHVAADQFTRPLYALREAARRLAGGGALVEPLDVDTNDELEDLARDFSSMAAVLVEQRQRLEGMIEERTRALETTHAELTDILENSADAIIVLDPEERVRAWNRGATALFGWEESEALGEPVADLIGPRGTGADREKAFIRRELERHGSVVNLEVERCTKSGERLGVGLTQTLVVGEGGRPTASSMIIRDGRLQARLEDQMRRSERLAAISVMAAGLAHELNNPLAIIGNRLECMERDLEEAPREEQLLKDIRVVREHVDRLGSITRDLLRFAREDGDAAGDVALEPLARRLVDLLERTFATRHLHLEIEAEPMLPSVPGDERALETVLANLLLNAADATPSGGTVTLRLCRDEARGTVEITVRDTGPGVPPEVRGRVFEPFFTTKGGRGGTGLGLTVCRSIVERHRGRIRVDEAEGEGGCFVVSLPLEESGVVWSREPAYS